MHWGGRGRLSSLLQRSASGGALRQREGFRPAARGMDPQKHSVGCLQGASQFPGRNWFPLGFWLGDGRGRWRWQAPLFPAKLRFFVWGSTTLPPVSSHSPHSPRAELFTFTIPDVKSRWLSEHTPSGPYAFASQTRGLCLAGRPPLRSGSLPLVLVARTTSPPFLPSSMGLSSGLAPETPFCSSSGGFLGYLGRCRWNLSD